MLLLSVLVAATALLADGASPHITHKMADGAHLIETSGNYGLSSPSFLPMKTGLATNDNCETVEIAPDGALWKKYKTFRNHLASIGTTKTFATAGYGDLLYSLESGDLLYSLVHTIQMSSITTDELAYSRTRRGDYSLMLKPNMPNNLARVFSWDGSVAFVYRDGQVDMRPRKCLSQSEIKLLAELQQNADKLLRQHQEKMKGIKKPVPLQHLRPTAQNDPSKVPLELQHLRDQLAKLFPEE